MSKWGGNWPYIDIVKERDRQDQKWGLQNHSPARWALILGEEIGEVSKALNENDAQGYKTELVQCAAVLVAMLENFERDGRVLENLPDREPSQPEGH